jgi:hypothetical protein
MFREIFSSSSTSQAPRDSSPAITPLVRRILNEVFSSVEDLNFSQTLLNSPEEHESVEACQEKILEKAEHEQNKVNTRSMWNHRWLRWALKPQTKNSQDIRGADVSSTSHNRTCG